MYIVWTNRQQKHEQAMIVLRHHQDIVDTCNNNSRQPKEKRT